MQGLKTGSSMFFSDEMCDDIAARKAVAMYFAPEWEMFKKNCPGAYGAGRGQGVGEVQDEFVFLMHTVQIGYQWMATSK